jgi:hypothetical protein
VSAPKAAASDERASVGGDVERYEQLRRGALAGAPGGSRLGLALLQRRGVSAWARAWQSTTMPAAVARPVAAEAGGEEIVGVLAAMALACITRG